MAKNKVLQNFHYEVLETINSESDRGCVLVSADALETHLIALLQRKLVNKAFASYDESKFSYFIREFKRPIHQDNQDGPPEPFENYMNSIFKTSLGDFQKKIDVAWGFGWVPKDCYINLVAIKHIRNHFFAHSFDKISLSDEEILNYVENLHRIREGKVYEIPLSDENSFEVDFSTPKGKFMDAVLFSFDSINYEIVKMESEKEGSVISKLYL